MTANRDTKADVTVVGAGLAGCEAAWQLARRGLGVRLVERKPRSFSPAHRSDGLAELVCSNSLGAAAVESASGLLKEELRRQDSLVLAAAEKARVPAGAALAVDRDVFSAFITEAIEGHPRIEIVRDEVAEIPAEGPTIVATGPLTADALAAAIARRTGAEYLYFHDAISPVVEADSIDLSIAYRKSRYDKGGDDYLNCPLTREEYDAFVDAVATGEKVELKDFETLVPFEGCQPIEVMVERGRQTLAFGPMKPVGLEDPRTGRRPHAVVQLRQENRHGTLWNLVGFQTKLKWPEQKRIFRMIPGLQHAEFARLGSLHRNTFLNTPVLLDKGLRLKSEPRIRFAGQIVGVEGYVDSTAMGCYVARALAAELQGRASPPPPATTMTGALLAYVTEADPKHFQPMNANFGLLPPLEGRKLRKAERKAEYARRGLADFDAWNANIA